MSWETFKQNILRVANSPEGISDIDVVAESYAKEYDSAVKQGFDRTHSIPLVSGNVEMMKIFFKSALQKGLTASQPYDLVGEMGEGVKAYWAGAVMATAPIPIQPAPGSTSNIQVTKNTVTDVGIWKQPQSSANTEPNFELSNERRAEVQEQLERATTNYNTAVVENRTVDASTLEDEINKCESILIENEEYRITIPPLENKIEGVGVQPITTTTTTAAPTSTYVVPTPNPSDPIQTQEEIDAEIAAFLDQSDVGGVDSGETVTGFKWNQGKPFVQGFRAGSGGGGFSSGGSGIIQVDFGALDLSADWITLAAAFIGKKEGFSEKAVNDEGNPRLGFGTSKILDPSTGQIRTVIYGDTTTVENALKVLQYEVSITYKARLVGTESNKISEADFEALNNKQKAALLSMVYNCGSLPGYTGIAAAVRNKDYAAATNGILNGPTKGAKSGIVYPGLVRRRAEEATLFST